MKRTFRRFSALLLCAALLLTLGACTKKEDPTAQTGPATTATTTTPTATTTAPAASTTATEPDPGKQTPHQWQLGEPRDPERGVFRSGRTIAFADVTYAAFSDGIFRLTPNGGQEMVAAFSLPYSASFCTDGFTLYYVDGAENVLNRCELDRGDRITPVFSALVGESKNCCGVVGVGDDRIYLQDLEWSENEDEHVVVVSLKNGAVLDKYEYCYGGCDGGLTFVKGSSFDVSPTRLVIFDPAGNEVVSCEYSWNAAACDGAVWYSPAGNGMATGVQELRKVTMRNGAAQDEVALSYDTGERMAFGWTNGGFLAGLTCEGSDGYYTTVYYDLRDGRKLEDYEHNIVGDEQTYWYHGETIDGVDYLINSNRVARMTEAGPAPLIELPSDMNSIEPVLMGHEALIPAGGGAFYRVTFDPDVWQHVVPTSLEYARYERYDGKSGATVYTKTPILIGDGPWYYDKLNEKLRAYNDSVAEATSENADECLRKAAELIGNGFAAPEDPFTATTDILIQRSDVNVFSFVEHQWIDTTVSRGDVDLWTGYNFDRETGEPIILSDVVTDLPDLKKAAVACVRGTSAASPDDIAAFLNEYLDDCPSSAAFSWVLGYEGLTFWFNPQINFTAANQVVTLTIPYADYPDLFTETATFVPRDYAYDVMLDDCYEQPLYLASDSGLLYFEPSAHRSSENGLVDRLEISSGSGQMTDGCFADRLYGTIVHIGSKQPVYGEPACDGKNYLVVQTTGDGMELHIYELKANGAKVVCRYGVGALAHHMPENDFSNEWAPYIYHCWFGDPNMFTIVDDDMGYGLTSPHFYTFNGGAPETIDVSGGSLAVG